MLLFVFLNVTKIMIYSFCYVLKGVVEVCVPIVMLLGIQYCCVTICSGVLPCVTEMLMSFVLLCFGYY